MIKATVCAVILLINENGVCLPLLNRDYGVNAL